MDKIYYFLVCYFYENNSTKGQGRAMIGFNRDIESFSDIKEVEELIQTHTQFDVIAVSSFQPLKYGFVGDEIDGNKTYC